MDLSSLVLLSLVSGVVGYFMGRPKQRGLIGSVLELFGGPVGLVVINFVPAPMSNNVQENVTEEAETLKNAEKGIFWLLGWPK